MFGLTPSDPKLGSIRVWMILAGVSGLILSGLVTFRPAKTNTLSALQKQQISSEKRLLFFGQFLCNTAHENRNRRIKPYELISELDATAIEFFFRSHARASKFRDRGGDVHKLDSEADYFIAPPNNAGILVFERPDSWDNKSVAVVSGEHCVALKITRMSEEHLFELLGTTHQ